MMLNSFSTMTAAVSNGINPGGGSYIDRPPGLQLGLVFALNSVLSSAFLAVWFAAGVLYGLTRIYCMAAP